jgi:signal transduction histidine kinase
MKNKSAFHALEQQFSESVYGQLLAISRDRISVREGERRSLAREIHDDIGQILVALGMDISLLKQKLLKKAQIMSRVELFNEIQCIATQIDNALESVHRVIAELRPETLNHLGLSAAIEWQAHEFQARTGIPVEIRSDLETIKMSNSSDATALFRIFQELLTNVGRHAMASRVEATIREDKEFFLMQIKDNGRGINKSDLQKSTSFGLLGLKERIFLLRGEVEIQGVPGNGTTVTVRIPLHVCSRVDEKELSENQR